MKKSGSFARFVVGCMAAVFSVATVGAIGVISTPRTAEATDYFKIHADAEVDSSASVPGNHAIAIGVAATASGDLSIAIGKQTGTKANNAIAIGTNAHANGEQSTALGYEAKATSTDAVAIGKASAGGARSVALGASSAATESDTVSVGNADTGYYRRIVNVAAASGDNDAVIYSQLKSVSSDLSTKISDASTALSSDLTSVKSNLSTVSNDFYGTGVRYTDSTKNTVAFGGTNTVNMTVGDGVLSFAKSSGGDVKLSGIANGTSTNDAVNFGQLSALQTQVNTIQGQVTAISSDLYKPTEGGSIQEKTENIKVVEDNKTKIENLADGVNDGDAVNKKQLEESSGMYFEVTETAEVAKASKSTLMATLTANTADTAMATLAENTADTADAAYVKGRTLAAGANLTLRSVNGKGVYALSENLTNLKSVEVGSVNINGTTNKISGIADGGIYSGSTEAINGGQLYTVYQDMNRLDKNIGYVGAHAAAMSALHAVPYNGTSRTTFTAGFGNYRGEQGYALGVFHYLGENVLANAAMSYNTGGDVMTRAGISFALGNGGHKTVTKTVYNAMEKKLAEQEQVISELQNNKTAQDKKIEQLMKTVELLNSRLSEVEKKK